MDGKKRKAVRKIRLFAVSVASVATIGAISAFYVSTDRVTNTFSYSNLEIKITEPDFVQDQLIVPDQQIVKNPYIENTDSTPSYVFMEVTVPAGSISVEKDTDSDEKGTLLSKAFVPLFRFVRADGTSLATCSA